jgi:hypothetical protein
VDGGWAASGSFGRPDAEAGRLVFDTVGDWLAIDDGWPTSGEVAGPAEFPLSGIRAEG